LWLMKTLVLNACQVITCNQAIVSLFRTADTQMEYMIGAIKLVAMIVSLMDMGELRK